MPALTIIVAILDVLACIGLVSLVIMQEGNSRGLGALTGGSTDTHYAQTGAKGKQARLKQLTKVFAIAFAVLTVILYLMTGRGA
ncbi:MAG TPA: preprotein translocase subunit SecG [Fastidiosipila sp.]|jgi:preprotein translocase subunit SecG|nr:preprotein translocase subunit SecG [Fastidiosipila sp.]